MNTVSMIHSKSKFQNQFYLVKTDQSSTPSRMRTDINTSMYVLALLAKRTSKSLAKKSAKDEEKKKDPLYKRYLESYPTVGPLGDDKYDFIVQDSEKREKPTIMMMQANNFPPPEDFTKDDIAHSPKILTRAINSTGPDQLSQAEKVLNW
ncbi:unnamed protein product [Thlaspi arvense]|uniref:Uncharacterized protein n=1 Tax=Thlaspi arvense TaxID=13288 RepID=A0AAU9RWI2_THLAR|nr:unnamed protein product [Thlaspi arvense]